MARLRHELKYLVSEAQAVALAEHARAFLRPDRHAPNGRYVLSSLYFDNANLRLCRESLEGVKNRYKLRIRCYSDDPEAPCFLEIKRRINQMIAKSRCRVPRSVVAPLLLERVSPARVGLRCDDPALGQFLFYCRQIDARPAVRVRYGRQSFESADGDLRMTFDRQLATVVTPTAELGLNGAGWEAVRRQPVVFELKFTNGYPGWVAQMVRAFGLTATSMSKYARSVTQVRGLTGRRGPAHAAVAYAPRTVRLPAMAPSRWPDERVLAFGKGKYGVAVADA